MQLPGTSSHSETERASKACSPPLSILPHQAGHPLPTLGIQAAQGEYRHSRRP